MLIVFILIYNFAKTNLTSIGLYPNSSIFPNSSELYNGRSKYWFVTHKVNGSINWLNNCINLHDALFASCNIVTGDISIAFANTYKFYDLEMQPGYDGSASTVEYYQNTYGHNIYGNISVFADKYDAFRIYFQYRTDIVGELKSLKNLKKLYTCYFLNCSVTGSKTDLWNNGANVYYFAI